MLISSNARELTRHQLLRTLGMQKMGLGERERKRERGRERKRERGRERKREKERKIER